MRTGAARSPKLGPDGPGPNGPFSDPAPTQEAA